MADGFLHLIKTMKIYMISGTLGVTGTPKVIYNISKNILNDVESVRVGYFGGDDDGVEKFINTGIPVDYLGGKFPSPQNPKRVYENLKEFNPDIVHTHMGSAAFLGRMIGNLNGCKVVSTIHNLYYERALRARAIDHSSCFLADATISVSKSVQRSLPVSYKITTISKVIHNCIDIKNVISQGKSRLDSHTQWASNLLSGPTIACVAQVSPKKGQKHLIKAFHSIIEDYPKANLVLTGWSDYKDKLENLAENLGVEENVHFVGKVPNPYTIYDMSDIISFPSKFEGFSIAMLEAMAFGKPIVSTDIGPFQEALGPNYQYASTENPNEIADLIRAYLADQQLAEKRGRIAKERVVNKFSGSIGAKKHLQLYNKVI